MCIASSGPACSSLHTKHVCITRAQRSLRLNVDEQWFEVFVGVNAEPLRSLRALRLNVDK